MGEFAMSAPARYSSLQKSLHWTTALFVVVMIPIGFYMVWRYFATDNDGTTVVLFDWHKLMGILLLCMIVTRITLRLRLGAPAAPVSMPLLQRMAASSVHFMLYVLLLVVPILGWAGASSYDILSLPAGLRLPPITPKNTDLAGQILGWHAWGAIALAVLACAHVGAALVHRFVLDDGIFERMWPRREKP
jgi:cytochrome b561